jgi:hypothetical protein
VSGLLLELFSCGWFNRVSLVFSMNPSIWFSCSVRFPCSSFTTLIGYFGISIGYFWFVVVAVF